MHAAERTRLDPSARTGWSASCRGAVPGALTSVLGVLALVYGFSTAGSTSWNSVPTVGSVLVGVALLILFVHLQRRTAHPVLPMAVVRDRDRGGAYLTVALGGIGVFGVFLFLAYHLQQIRRFTSIETGLAFVPMVVATAVLSILAGGVLLPRVGARAVVTGGFVLAAGTWGFTRLTADAGYPTGVLPGLLLCGAGLGMLFGPAMNLATSRIEPAHAGAAAVVNASQQIGAAIGTALLNAVAVGAADDHRVDRSARAADVLDSATVHGNRAASG